MEFFQHLRDVAIEVAHQYHRIVLCKLSKYFCAMSSNLNNLLINIFEHSIMLLLKLSLIGIPCSRSTQMLHFDANLHIESFMESIIALYYRSTTKGTLAMNVSLAKLFFSNRHLLTLVCMPQHLSPMTACSIECTAEIE